MRLAEENEVKIDYHTLLAAPKDMILMWQHLSLSWTRVKKSFTRVVLKLVKVNVF